MERPTQTTYNELQKAFDHINVVLFEGKLPPCLITLQRKANSCCYFHLARFVNYDGTFGDELAMNPEMFAVQPVESLSVR